MMDQDARIVAGLAGKKDGPGQGVMNAWDDEGAVFGRPGLANSTPFLEIPESHEYQSRVHPKYSMDRRLRE